ncbi:MAG TPA: glycine cleavage system protein H [Candidatus Sulfotelmatobacter sp.]|nr:glycine cleavage system protein H [Candidatus Sulfotelmatobacter sp.]
MPEFLETTVDKFTFKVAKDRWYTRDGVWLLDTENSEGGLIRIGLTDYLQQHSGDIAFVNLKPIATVLNTGDDFAEIETIKVNVGLPSPISGTVTEINKGLELHPELVNQDPYGKGWLMMLKPAEWTISRRDLLDADTYFAVMRKQIDEELRETS